ncbi:MAG: tetratricopeptide repeat protein [Chloroherpetonaceae bacterium]|nr:tetratricopeptide repeat protein [Chloroherpetonaceae bacterium]
MKETCTLLFALAMLLAASACNDPKAKAREDIQNLQEAVKYAPNNPKIFLRLGAAYASLGEYDKAIPAYQKL